MATLVPEVRAFLLEGTRTGKLATTRADGGPHVTPVWFTLDGDDLVLTTAATSVKGRNLRRDPRAALLVDLEEPPYAYVLVTGTVTLGDDLDELRRVAGAVGGRYMGEDRAGEFADRNGVPGELVVRLSPTRVVHDVDVSG
jgi:PPOX class probable F420-dependent enzyme